MRSIILFVLSNLFVVSLAVAAAEPTKVAYQVICDDASVAENLSLAIEKRLEEANLKISSEYPKAKLFVYAQQDINDRVNADGWSFAIAHATNYSTYYVAAKLLKNKSKTITLIEPTLMAMLQEEGFMRYMNVTHIDKLDETNVAIVMDSVVAEFVKRIPK
jgi:hypothetical protein